MNIYERCLIQKEKRQERLMELKEELEEEQREKDMKDLQEVAKMRARHSDRVRVWDDFIEDQNAWNAKKKEMVKEIRQEYDAAEKQLCPFRPKLATKPRATDKHKHEREREEKEKKNRAWESRLARMDLYGTWLANMTESGKILRDRSVQTKGIEFAYHPNSRSKPAGGSGDAVSSDAKKAEEEGGTTTAAAQVGGIEPEAAEAIVDAYVAKQENENLVTASGSLQNTMSSQEMAKQINRKLDQNVNHAQNEGGQPPYFGPRGTISYIDIPQTVVSAHDRFWQRIAPTVDTLSFNLAQRSDLEIGARKAEIEKQKQTMREIEQARNEERRLKRREEKQLLREREERARLRGYVYHDPNNPTSKPGAAQTGTQQQTDVNENQQTRTRNQQSTKQPRQPSTISTKDLDTNKNMRIERIDEEGNAVTVSDMMAANQRTFSRNDMHGASVLTHYDMHGRSIYAGNSSSAGNGMSLYQQGIGPGGPMFGAGQVNMNMVGGPGGPMFGSPMMMNTVGGMGGFQNGNPMYGGGAGTANLYSQPGMDYNVPTDYNVVVGPPDVGTNFANIANALSNNTNLAGETSLNAINAQLNAVQELGMPGVVGADDFGAMDPNISDRDH